MKKVAVVMGSSSDWPTMKLACEILDEFGISYHKEVVSAHRTPKLMYDFAENAKAKGYEMIIAGAGGAAHLPGMIASLTTLPVIGVPIKSSVLSGVDSLYSIVQMPGGVPVATMAIGNAGAKNAGLQAVRSLAVHDEEIHNKLVAYIEKTKEQVGEMNNDLI
ncbi:MULTISPECIES: 5-(carboxyamino)imidazole ribonucleotide mutase [unclassified Gemella]|uniref:5-(carboxyamino)imidazole ribonucleotide mutase n=1 Tax=unclassified Gemella TaxID=2624949 RepID=UPI001074674E|nr:MULTISPECIES: 5-(carboxyamino)imidazole ribonucleotide mutase [unclassified Gemella]MBF0710521.1 5-(carboxyamino)imidazole ribonucleotide mutase [Gemella sp. GL1.1]MBF0747198.1 5-(carboxyamino)imidazole ribonucleotide mutase [Gemella sp. 19428wG2_WT2a]NYS27865.1 5-(carboxyamino)imidazole ribonucleotide mutase [Gemella sp. GL1]TFU57994.1 5-(carboxyamino)imidazole ribonucleotide mutase [Gemella sp. WT2a]